MIMRGDSCPRGCEFESHHRIQLDGPIFTFISCKIVSMFEEIKDKTKKRPGMAHFKLTT